MIIDTSHATGEALLVPERMIVAPAVGIFRPAGAGTVAGALVDEGDPIGVVEGPGTAMPIRSPFAGTLVGMLAHPGERLREGQPVAWLRVA
ncbi:MAG TPA: biotin/lipoyl-containing protein [Acidimicrobiia bacterium]